MEINTLWKTIIKLFGIWILIDSFSIIPQFSQTFIYMNANKDIEYLFYVILFFGLSILFYFLVVRLFLFKTHLIIDKLKLDKNYIDKKIDLNIKSSTVISIAIIIIGGITLVDSIPRLLSEIVEFLQQKMLIKEYPKFSWIILQALKSIIGYLLITNSKRITNLIEKEVA